MKFDAKSLKYLAGRVFSNGLKITISKPEATVLDRFELLERLISNKKIIHLGCCDHVSLIKEKVKAGVWLHSRLCKKAARCVGLDIDKEGIDYLKNQMNYSDVICADLMLDKLPEIRKNKWDYIVLGEVLEHVSNPSMFLKNINEKYKKNIGAIIITVPNAFSWLNTIYAFRHKEFINTDHRYWFTPYTLAKVLTNAGFKVDDFYFCEPFQPRGFMASKVNIKNALMIFILKKFPALRRTLIVVARL
ncbi:MAG: class I SAM-dependent methyltransferase [Candidatus Aenigmarchaeota archaeon]|nr:class I SAM-dependent methyltransferase [Candidatus Aenigmarchaeota archaeon]